MQSDNFLFATVSSKSVTESIHGIHKKFTSPTIHLPRLPNDYLTTEFQKNLSNKKWNISIYLEEPLPTQRIT